MRGRASCSGRAGKTTCDGVPHWPRIPIHLSTALMSATFVLQNTYGGKDVAGADNKFDIGSPQRRFAMAFSQADVGFLSWACTAVCVMGESYARFSLALCARITGAVGVVRHPQVESSKALLMAGFMPQLAKPTGSAATLYLDFTGTCRARGLVFEHNSRRMTAMRSDDVQPTS